MGGPDITVSREGGPVPLRVLVAARSRLLSEAIATALSNDAHLEARTTDPGAPPWPNGTVDVLVADAGAAAALNPEHIGTIPTVVIGERSSDAGDLRPARRVPFDAEVAELVASILAAARGVNVPPHKAPRRTNRRRRSEDRQDTLTPRETEVLQLLAAGKSTPGIAKELGVSPHTVRTHVQNTMAKLDARSKMDAVAQARRLGLPGLALDRRETG